MFTLIKSGNIWQIGKGQVQVGCLSQWWGCGPGANVPGGCPLPNQWLQLQSSGWGCNHDWLFLEQNSFLLSFVSGQIHSPFTKAVNGERHSKEGQHCQDHQLHFVLHEEVKVGVLAGPPSYLYVSHWQFFEGLFLLQFSHNLGEFRNILVWQTVKQKLFQRVGGGLVKQDVAEDDTDWRKDNVTFGI